MSLPPDEPTRPLGRPAGPPPGSVDRETVVAADDPAFRAEVVDRLRALRVWAALATLLSLVALGLAAWLYLEEDDERDGNRAGGVRSSEVLALEDRIDRLEARPDQVVEEADIVALQEDQAALATQVEELAAQVEAEAGAEPAPAAAEDPEARASIEALDASVRDLDGRVRALEQQSSP